MAEKILFDLEKFRSYNGQSRKKLLSEGILSGMDDGSGLKSILELAVFQFSCRKCSDAPCIDVCSAGALEKTEEGYITRAINLCIACKSCVVICPFGTMMNGFFSYHRDEEKLYDVMDKKELELLIKNSPEGAIQVVNMEEDPKQHIFKLNDHILVKEQEWKSDKL